MTAPSIVGANVGSVASDAAAAAATAATAAQGNVATSGLANGTIANGAIANGNVANGNTANGTIANGNIANSSIAPGNVANGNIASGNATPGTIATGSIPSAMTGSMPSATAGPLSGAPTGQLSSEYVGIMERILGLLNSFQGSLKQIQPAQMDALSKMSGTAVGTTEHATKVADLQKGMDQKLTDWSANLTNYLNSLRQVVGNAPVAASLAPAGGSPQDLLAKMTEALNEMAKSMDHK